MENLLDTAKVGIIILDQQILIRSFTREATRVFRLAASDVGWPLSDNREGFADCELALDCPGVSQRCVRLNSWLFFVGTASNKASLLVSMQIQP